MGYNLAIEYLADYEKTWMLDSFRVLNERVLVPQQRGLSEWLFLEVTNFSFYSVTLSHSRHVILPISCQAFPNAARIHPTMPDPVSYFRYHAVYVHTLNKILPEFCKPCQRVRQ